MKKAADCAMNGQLTVFIIKQLKGAGVHAAGAKSHNLYPGDSFDKPDIAQSLQKRALSPHNWQLVRDNFRRAGGGPAGRTVVTEFELELPELGELPKQAFAIGDKAVPSTAMGALVGEVGRRDRVLSSPMPMATKPQR